MSLDSAVMIDVIFMAILLLIIGYMAVLITIQHVSEHKEYTQQLEDARVDLVESQDTFVLPVYLDPHKTRKVRAAATKAMRAMRTRP